MWMVPLFDMDLALKGKGGVDWCGDSAIFRPSSAPNLGLTFPLVELALLPSALRSSKLTAIPLPSARDFWIQQHGAALGPWPGPAFS